MKYVEICNLVMKKGEDEYGTFGEHDMYTCLGDDGIWIYRPSNDTLYVSESKTDIALGFLRDIVGVNSSILYVDEKYLNIRAIGYDLLDNEKLYQIPREYIQLNDDIEKVEKITNVVGI